jgi:hypothetical protein
VRKEVGDDPASQVDRAWLIALGRLPAAEEKRAAEESLRRLMEEWGRQPGGGANREKALADFCHAMVNSAAFLYVD